MISLDEAYRLTLDHIQPLHVETVDLLAAAGRIAVKTSWLRWIIQS